MALFLNHKKSQCGVYNYGIRLYNIWKKSTNIICNYKEIDNLYEYNTINFNSYKVIFYNFHSSTMTWLNSDNISKINTNIGILHESSTDIFNYTIDASTIPRPIFETIPLHIKTPDTNILNFINYGLDLNIPIIGSFGFGFTNKGFDKIVQHVNDEYDEAIIKIVMPFAHFGDISGDIAKYVTNLCNIVNRKPSIKILIIHDFLDDDDILYFLSKNTINLFLYDTMIGRGISSTIDFAMSVDTPIGISDSYMFRHIYNESICIYKKSIKECISNNKEYINKFRNINSHINNIKFFESIVNNYI
jgi:hypothetical protein